jgi:tRNA threonylcarbamoyladenosine biosynthesis protein TsaE
MDSVTRTISTLEDMEREATACIAALPSETSSATLATLVTLSGELGAGKTTFAQFVAKALGIEDTVNSPTFVIEKIYSIPQASPNGVHGIAAHPSQKWSRLVHIDAYRLQSVGDLTTLGFGELVSHPGTLILLEWPEQVVGISEQASVRILLEILPDGTRQITYA